MKKLLLALGLIIALVPVNSFAGKLDDFESSATKKKSRDHSRSHEDRGDHHHGHSDDGCHGFFSCLFSIFIQVNASPSYEVEEDDPQQSENPSGDTLITFDVAYQNMQPDIFGLDSSFQLRLKWVNIEGRFTRYIETAPFDVLDVNQLKVVYPMRLGRSVTVGGALGIYQLVGNNVSTGGSFGFPIVYKAPGSSWAFGVTPLWANINGNTITDVDYRASYSTGKINYFAGHRAINTGSQSLSGPYIGLGYSF